MQTQDTSFMPVLTTLSPFCIEAVFGLKLLRIARMRGDPAIAVRI
jgi:hypothetical protein